MLPCPPVLARTRTSRRYFFYLTGQNDRGCVVIISAEMGDSTDGNVFRFERVDNAGIVSFWFIRNADMAINHIVHVTVSYLHEWNNEQAD